MSNQPTQMRIHLMLLQRLQFIKKNIQEIKNHLNSLGKSKSLSTIKNHVDNFNPEQIQTIVLKRKIIEPPTPIKKLKLLAKEERISIQILVKDQKLSDSKVGSVFNTSIKIVLIQLILKLKKLGRPSKNPLGDVTDEEFSMMAHLIEIAHFSGYNCLTKKLFDLKNLESRN